MRNNPYAPISEEEKTKRQQAEEASRQRVVDTINAAKKCLETEEFKRYKEGYDKTADELVNQLCDYDNPDPVQYAFAMKDMITRLRLLRFLVTRIEGDASLKVKDVDAAS